MHPIKHLPEYWFSRRGDSDLNWIKSRMTWIPEDKQRDVAIEYSRIFLSHHGRSGRGAANGYLHAEEKKYRNGLA